LQAHARDVGADVWQAGVDFRHEGDRQQWSWSGRGRRRNALGYPALRGANQLLNASGVLAALEALRDRLPVPAQAVRNGLAMVQLPGRFQVQPGQPTLVLDVAHNPQAAAVLAVNLDQMGFYPRTHVVLGAMADKDLAGVIAPLLPLVDSWQLCDLPTARAASAGRLAELVSAQRQAALAAGQAVSEAAVSTHASPSAALQHILGHCDPADRIVVFGSFFTVGDVLQQGLPRLGAAHLG
jgi:dihydrofolate synthase/folylpolyglutamate synthase